MPSLDIERLNKKTAYRIAAFVFFASLWPAPLAAQSASEVLRDFGIIGRWTTGDTSCQALSVTNDVETYSVLPSGDVEERLEFGPGRNPNVSIIHQASRVRPDQVMIIATFNKKNQTRVWVVQNGKFRTISNMDENGTYLVKDGVIVGNGDPTQWSRRCR